MTDTRERLRQINTFPSLVNFLRDDLDWPIDSDDFEDLTFDYTAAELGIDPAIAAKIEEIKRMRPLVANQPWGIFFVKFEPKQLPVVALRRILNSVVVKKRATASAAEQQKWATDDLLFISNYGEDDERRISFAHFSRDPARDDLPTLKVLAWDDLDTSLHLEHAAATLVERLSWPSSEDEWDDESWRERWSSAFELRHREVITTSKALAERLADLARAIRDRILTVLEIETEDGEITALMESFREALVHDLDAEGFADMYAQTIAYGLLSGRITNPGAAAHDRVPTKLPVTNPFLRELMETFLHVEGDRAKNDRPPAIDFDELGVSEVIGLLNDANMEAVVRDFGDKNPQEDPVIHFYELFLKEFDKEQKVKRGVFYTPRPVVSYIVRSVHEVLQNEFGLTDGLADTATWEEMAERHAGLEIPEGVRPTDRFVTVLDPATGTGTFLVEAIEVIHRTLVEKWELKGYGESKILDLWNAYVPEKLLPRLHGYELMMAPYAIAHLKIGMKLYETGYRFGSSERVRIYLTNALEPPQDFSDQLPFDIPALAHEAEAVNEIKKKQAFTIVIGNPPYAGYSANEGAWIEQLMERYKTTVRTEERQIQRLSNDYVKFIRLSEYLLAKSQVGVLGFITDNGYLNGILFRDMRAALRNTFPRAAILDLHGVAMRGAVRRDVVDDNVFDITQGVAIGLFVRNPPPLSSWPLLHAELIGLRDAKYGVLSSTSSASTEWRALHPGPPRWFFVESSSDEDYESWPLFTELIGTGSPKRDRDTRYGTGIKTRHDDFVIGWTADDAIARVGQVAHREEDDVELIRELGLCTTAHFSIGDARKRAETNDLRDHVETIEYRPFDSRWLVYLREFVCEPKAETMRHMLHQENVAMAVLRRDRKETGTGFFVARGLIAKDLVSNLDDALVWPLYLFPREKSLLSGKAGQKSGTPNIAPTTIELLTAHFGLSWRPVGRGDLPTSVGPEDIFNYIYAILHSPGYRTRYAEFLKTDFPRLPLTSELELFCKLAHFGRELVSLHLLETPAQQALSSRYDKGAKGWRYEARDGKQFSVALSFNGSEEPVVGKVGWSNDTVWLDAVKPMRGVPSNATVTGTVGFSGVTEEVWNFRIGGYQVCEKWLKDRGPKKGLPGRILTAEDIAQYHRIVIALHETIRVMGGVDDVIEEHGGWPDAFMTSNDKDLQAGSDPQADPVRATG